MKIFKSKIAGLMALAVCAMYVSCKREIPQVSNLVTDFSNSARVQVINATVKATRNYVYVDGVPVSGAAFAYGAVFPATANSFNVSAGTRSFLIKDTLVTSTQVPLNFTQAFEGGKSYTIFTYDTISSTKKSVVVNNIVIPNDTTARLRFANFIYNNTVLGNVDVYSFRRGTSAPVFSNVASSEVTEFIPFSSGVNDTLYVYATGTTSPLIVKALVPVLVATRSYSSVYNGSYKGTRALTTFATY